MKFHCGGRRGSLFLHTPFHLPVGPCFGVGFTPLHRYTVSVLETVLHRFMLVIFGVSLDGYTVTPKLREFWVTPFCAYTVLRRAVSV